MSLSAYLAKNYLNSSTLSTDPSDLSTRPKKRRKKDKSTLEPSSSLIVADDDDLSLHAPSTFADEDDSRPIFDQSHSTAEFRKSKKNNWQALAGNPPAARDTDTDNDAAAADRILASAAAEQSAHHAEIDNEDAPAIVADASVPKMSSGIRAGLQTAADSERLEAEAAHKAASEAKALKKSRKPSPPPEETVYRDATGRRIDVSMKRAEARAAEVARLKAEAKEKADTMGEVQLAAREKGKEDLAEAKFLTVARGADDEEMNEELKGRVRWDDPMAGYMAVKQAEEMPAGARQAAAGTSKPRKKEYAGAAPPNRYGVRPGWRWDGVDRGNGFEKEWFQARGKQARTRDLEYQWQMDE